MVCTFRALGIYGYLVLLISPAYGVCCWFVDGFAGWGSPSLGHLGAYLMMEGSKAVSKWLPQRLPTCDLPLELGDSYMGGGLDPANNGASPPPFANPFRFFWLPDYVPGPQVTIPHFRFWRAQGVRRHHLEPHHPRELQHFDRPPPNGWGGTLDTDEED